MDKDGTVVEVEEQIALDKLPPEVKDGLKDKAGKAKILQVETLTKHGQLVAYEAQVLSHERSPRSRWVLMGSRWRTKNNR